MATKIKNIKFRLELTGNGIVNTEGSNKDLLYLLKEKCGRYTGQEVHDNIILGKRYITELPENEQKVILTRKDGTELKKTHKDCLKISSECLRHAIFERDAEFKPTNLHKVPEIAMRYMASYQYIVRGDLLTRSDNTSFNKTSAISVISAIENSGSEITLDVHSCSGERTDNSFYYKEEIGDTKYETSGYINLSQLMFMSADIIGGRQAVDTDWLMKGSLDNVFKSVYGRVPYTKGYFCSNTQTYGDAMGEYGMKFDNEFIVYLVKESLKRILDINIIKSKAYAKTSKLQICLVENAGASLDGEEKWITINNYEDIENLSFEVFNFYKECDGKEVENIRKEVEKIVADEKKEKDAKKGGKKK